MKNKPTRYLVIFLSLSMAFSILYSCQEEEIPPSVIQFSASVQNVTEGNQAQVVLSLDRPAPNNTTLSITFESNGTLDKNFTINPELIGTTLELNISKGDKSISFQVNALDNPIADGGKFIIFTLSEVDNALKIGSKSTLTLIINDDEGPSVANFEKTEQTINENDATGIIIKLPLSAMAKGTGNISISFLATNGELGKGFLLDKTAVSNSFKITVNEGDTEASFKITPVQDDFFKGDIKVSFKITETTGVIKQGTVLQLDLTIKDDELPSAVEFPSNGSSIGEKQVAGLVIDLPFSSPAKGTGKIIVAIESSTAKYETNYTTIPAPKSLNLIELPVSYNDVKSTLTILPMNDFTVSGNMEVKFSIQGVEGVLQKGTKLAYTLTIINEDIPVKVNFAESSRSVREDSSLVVHLPFTGPAPGGGQIYVALTKSTNQSSFTTIPTASNNTIILPFDKNATGVSFKVTPNNDTNCQNLVVSNTMHWQVSTIIGNAVEKGDKIDYDLTIKDDEVPALITFAESAASIMESSLTAKVVQLNFSKPLPTNETIYITTGWWAHQSRLITSPPYDYNCNLYCYDPAFSVASGATNASFTITPINNNNNEPDYQAIFTIYSSNSCLQSDPQSKFTLTIIDED